MKSRQKNIVILIAGGLRKYALHVRYLLFIVLLFCQNVAVALTYKDYENKFQSYLPLVPESLQAQARHHYIHFASLLLPCYRFLADKGYELAANELLHGVMQQIADHAHQNSREIYAFLESQLHSLPLDIRLPIPIKESSRSFEPYSPDSPDFHSIAFLQALAQFSLNPESGQSQLVMHEKRAWHRQLFQLYRQDLTSAFDIWNFLMPEEHFQALLEFLQIAEEDIQQILATTSSSVLSPDSGQNVQSGEYGLLRFSLRSVDSLKCVNIKQFVFQTEKNTYKQLMSVDIGFKPVLPEHDYLLWQSIGWIPVITLQEILNEATTLFNTLPEKAVDFVYSMETWKLLEQMTPQLDDLPDVSRQLAAFNPAQLLSSVPPAPAGIYTPATSTKPDIPPETPDLKLLTMPLLPLQMTVAEKQRSLQQKIKDSIRQSKAHSTAQYQIDKDKFQQSLYDLEFIKWSEQDVSEEESEIVLYERQKELYTVAAKYRKHYRTNLESYFITHFDRYCERNCLSCKILKGTYYTILGHQLLSLAIDFNTLFRIIRQKYRTPLMLGMAAQAKAMTTGLKLTAKNHEKEAHLIKNKQSIDPSLAEREELSVPDILPDIVELYEFIYEQYQQLISQNPSQAKQFLEGISQWREQLFIINQHAAKLRLQDHDALLKCTMLQVQVIGVLLNDLEELYKYLPDDLKCLEGVSSCSEDLKVSFNLALKTVLHSKSWFSDYSDEIQLSAEQIEELLRAMQESSLLNDICKLRIVDIYDIRHKLEQTLEQQRQKAEQMAREMARELTEREEVLRTARLKLKEKTSNQQLKGHKYKKKKKNKKKNIALTNKEHIKAKEPEEPKQQWEILQDEAHDYASNKRYKEAVKFLRQSIRKAPEQEAVLVKIDLADTFLLSTEERRKNIQTLQKDISLFHLAYQRVANNPKQSGILFSRERLVQTARQLAELWTELEADMKQATQYHQEALHALEGASGFSDADFSRELLHRSLEAISTFHQQIIETRKKLLQTFSYRREWLSQLHTTRIKNGSTRQPEILKLIQQIQQQQHRHEKISRESDVLAVQARKLGDTTAPPPPISLDFYQQFSVTGDGDCFFSSLAIALNNLQGTHWSAREMRIKIHTILDRIIRFIHQHPDNPYNLQSELSNLLGLDFNTLEVMVDENILLQSPQAATGATNCPASTVQQYGEINLLLLIQLVEDIPTGVLLPDSPELQLYNGYLWLSIAPNLLAALVQEGEFNVGHWSEDLQQALSTGALIPAGLTRQIQYAPVTTILSHSGVNPLLQHFEVSILSPEKIIKKAAEMVMTVTLLFMLKTNLSQAQVSQRKY